MKARRRKETREHSSRGLLGCDAV